MDVALSFPVPAPAAASRWLGDTELLQHQHPRVRLLALRLTQLEPGPWRKAVACHEFVRLLPVFGREPGWRQSSLEVLRRGRCDTLGKATLLIAMLRSLGILARLHLEAAEGARQRVGVEVRVECLWVRLDLGVLPADAPAASRHLVFDDVQHFWRTCAAAANDGSPARASRRFARAMLRRLFAD